MDTLTNNESALGLSNGTRPRPDAKHCGTALPSQGDSVGFVRGGREARSAAGNRLGNR